MIYCKCTTNGAHSDYNDVTAGGVVADSFEVVDDSHVGNDKSSRSYFLFSTWARNISSEVSFDSSEVLFLAYVENFHFPRGDWRIATWGTAFLS